jgi:hypothetical protein
MGGIIPDKGCPNIRHPSPTMNDFRSLGSF